MNFFSSPPLLDAACGFLTFVVDQGGEKKSDKCQKNFQWNVSPGEFEVKHARGESRRLMTPTLFHLHLYAIYFYEEIKSTFEK